MRSEFPQSEEGGTSALVSRRKFLKQTAVIAAAGVASVSLPAAEQPKWVVACRDMHAKVAPGRDSWDSLKQLGAEGVEVSVGLDLGCPNLASSSGTYSLASPAAIAALKKDAAAAGCRITAFMLANRLEERLEQEVKWTRAVVEAAMELGVPAIRIDVWPVKMSVDKFLPFAIDACRKLCETAAGTSVRFGIENHGRVTNDPDFLDKLFQGVGSPQLGITLDCANLYWFGHPLRDLYGIYERFAPRVVHTHCKNINYPEDKRNTKRPIGWEYDKYSCPIYSGDIDFKRLVAILRKANYRGDLCLEDESLGRFPEAERAGIVRRELSMLKSLV